MLGIMN